jgi:hypothetical protein
MKEHDKPEILLDARNLTTALDGLFESMMEGMGVGRRVAAAT